MPEPKQFFYQQGEAVIGPLTGIELREEAFAGNVGPDTPVRLGGSEQWVPASRMSNLFDGEGKPLPHPPEAQAVLEAARRKTAAIWYIRQEVRVLGPFSADELRSKAESGEISPRTRILKGAQGKWVPAATVKGLFALSEAEIEAIAAEVLLPPLLLDEPGEEAGPPYHQRRG